MKYIALALLGVTFLLLYFGNRLSRRMSLEQGGFIVAIASYVAACISAVIALTFLFLAI